MLFFDLVAGFERLADLPIFDFAAEETTVLPTAGDPLLATLESEPDIAEVTTERNPADILVAGFESLADLSIFDFAAEEASIVPKADDAWLATLGSVPDITEVTTERDAAELLFVDFEDNTLEAKADDLIDGYLLKPLNEEILLVNLLDLNWLCAKDLIPYGDFELLLADLGLADLFFLDPNEAIFIGEMSPYPLIDPVVFLVAAAAPLDLLSFFFFIVIDFS